MLLLLVIAAMMGNVDVVSCYPSFFFPTVAAPKAVMRKVSYLLKTYDTFSYLKEIGEILGRKINFERKLTIQLTIQRKAKETNTDIDND